MPDASAVVVLAPNWLGDAVMALPAIADLRRHFESARLIVAARRSVASLFSLVPGVDEVVTLDARGRGLEIAAVLRDAGRLRRLGADVVVLLPNSFASGVVAWLSRIPERWGYGTDGRPPLLTRPIARPVASQHQSLYYQALVRALGVANGPTVARIEVPSEVSTEARRRLEHAGWTGRPLMVLAPGAAYGTAKRWWPEHFATLARSAIESDDIHCVFVGAAADRASVDLVVGRLPASAKGRMIDLCGETSLQILAAILSLAQVCVSNDSGAMHLAGAAGVPLAALFGPTNERETAPLTWPNVATELLIHPVSCRPCMLRECPIDHPCMRDLAPVRVLEVVRDLLRTPASSSSRYAGALSPHVTEVP